MAAYNFQNCSIKGWAPSGNSTQYVEFYAREQVPTPEKHQFGWTYSTDDHLEMWNSISHLKSRTQSGPN